MKIAVYAIALNESLHVKRFCDAAKDADLIFVADTGSTDETIPLLEECGAKVAHISIKPWRFDDARNAALAMLPTDIDVCVSLDLDEVLQPGWRQEIERVWVEGTTRLRYGFDWGCGIVFKYEKIHGRRGYRWHHPCHEYPVPDRIEEIWANTDMLLVVHQPDSTKPRSQYLDLLKISIEEDPACPRNAFYYARELSFHRQWNDAIVQAQRYLALPRATWPNERCYAMRVIGRCYQELDRWADSLTWLRRASSEAPDTREPWHDLALACYRTSRWPECFGAALNCLSITNRELVYTVDPTVWGAAPHDLASIAAWNMGLHQIALDHAKKAVELSPDDLRLRQNLKFCSEKVDAA
jgi:glycosyltransferase involved in cell wall biosynthesis